MGARIARLAIVLILVTIFTAVLTELMPGDPVKVIAPMSSEEQRVVLAKGLGFDKPMPVRYVNWLGDFVTGDMGNSYSGPTSKDPVFEKVKEALPVSLELMIMAQFIALVIAIPLAVYSAYRAGGWLDTLISNSSFALLSIPPFVLAFVLTYYLKVEMGWFTGNFERLEDGIGPNLNSLFLPVFSLAASQVAVYLRLLRSDTISTLQQDFVLMARSKGISDWRILWRHALRPSTITLITAAGLNVGALIGGALVVERIFAIPGMGQEVATAMGARQVVALQSLVAVIALVYVTINVLVDVLYRVVDPRMRNA